jgi:hypothetical protein
VNNKLSEPQPEDVVAAYSLKTDSGLKTIIFNKNPNAGARLVIDPGQRCQGATMLPLSAPGLEAASGVTLGGSAVVARAAWSPTNEPPLPGNSGVYSADLPPASAALISFSD